VERIAPATYTAKPDHIPLDDPWSPRLEEAAMAFATALYGPRVPVLYGLGAARFHHAIPRAIGVTVVAVPQQHRPVTLSSGGRVIFTKVDTDGLQARAETGELGRFLVTTVEQTLVNLVERPELGGMPHEAAAATRALREMADRTTLEKLKTSTRFALALRELTQ
ncbi:MAG TPA: hypothetical protein K8V15_06805, partial [Tessaracoccus flavescens]|nr:hypothetical protein [Tessaracoccus flavescens]